MQRNPEQIKSDLIRLTEEARAINVNLVRRLEDIHRWIHHKKPGLLKSKEHLIQFLEELINFTDVWLKIQFLPEIDQQTILAGLSKSERYWYEYLFPNWINEEDPKLKIWKQKLMDGSFKREDTQQVKSIRQRIKHLGGDSFTPYIADLSMATDIITTASKGLPVCVQITTLSIIYTLEKQDKWLQTLNYWKIQRGLFISFNPTLNQVLSRICQHIFEYSDLTHDTCYSIVNLDN